MEWPGAGGSFPRSQGRGAHAGESCHDPFSAEATHDQEQMEMRKSEHDETGDHIMPYHLSHSAVRPTRTTDKALRENFHLPLAEVARKFGMCTTAFKKLCRKQGIMHWPHRALRSVEKKIASLRAEAKFTNDQGYIDEQVCKLEQKRESILSGIGLNAGWEEEVDEDNSNTSSLSSTSRSVRSDSPSLGDGASSTHTTLTEDGSNTSADRPRRIHSMHDVRQYARLNAEDDDQSAQPSARSSLQRRSASYDSMVSFAEQGSVRTRGFRTHQHESLEWGLQGQGAGFRFGMSGLAPLGGMWGDEMEGATYSDRGAGRRDPREALEGLAVGMHNMGRPAHMASGGVFGAQAARGSNWPDLPQKKTGGEHDPPLESTVRELMVENWRMRAIIHNLAFERDHWNKVSVDAEAEAAKYRLTARSLQGELAQVRQFSMGGLGGAMGGGMSRERQLYHAHALAEGGEQGGGQSHVRGAGMGLGGASGRLMQGGGSMGGTYEQMGDAVQMLLRVDGDEETHDGDTQASSTPRHRQGGRQDGLH